MQIQDLLYFVCRSIGAKACVAIGAVSIALLSALSGAYSRLEPMLADSRDRMVSLPCSGNVAIVGLDQETFDALGGLPLRRSYYAKVLEQLDKAGTKRVYVDVFFQAPSNEGEDQSFQSVLEHMGDKVALPQARLNANSSKLSQPIERFANVTRLVAAELNSNRQHRIEDHGRDGEDTNPAPSAAAWLAHGADLS